MGRAKQHMLEMWERGYDEQEGAVCAGCVEDYALNAWVKDNLSESECSFCGAQSEAQIAAEFDAFVGVVLEGLRFDWNDPDNEGIMYISREGGYQAPTYDSWDIVGDFGFAAEDVETQVADALSDKMWVKRDFYYGTESDHLSWGWERLKEFVKNHSRYFFLQEQSQEPQSLSPGDVLNALAGLISSELSGYGLVSKLPVETDIYRVRVDADAHSTAAQIGPPPTQYASQSNRMSPAGIPMFYGAFEASTAIAETFDPAISSDKILSIGKFNPTRPLKMLNLAELPFVPSVFDQTKNGLIHPLRFLHGFANDIAAPIKRDGYEHIEYVPTQVVTEYFRRVFRTADGDAIDGIVYRSSRESGTEAVVIFCENSNCIDEGETEQASTLLKLTSVSHEQSENLAEGASG
ncbi:MAG: HEPN-associated N-terminal domain-containing protein [Pseudomonadota bacterium]